MAKQKKLKPSQYYKKIILGLGEQVYSREELEKRIAEIDSSLGIPIAKDKKNHGCHCSAIMRNIKEMAPELLSILTDDATKGGMICYQIINSAKCANKVEKSLKEKEDNERARACEYAKKKYAAAHSSTTPKKQEEKLHLPPELQGRKVRPIELPKVAAETKPFTGQWTAAEHDLIWLIGGLIKLEDRGLGEGDIVRTLKVRCGISTTIEDVRTLVKREPNLEYNAHSGVVIRLKRSEDGTNDAAWKNIDRLHGPKNVKRILIVRSDQDIDTIRSIMKGCEVTIISDEKMVGTLYQISVSGLEDNLIHAAILYGKMSPVRAEFMHCAEHPGYITLVKNTWGKIEPLLKQNSLRYLIESIGAEV